MLTKPCYGWTNFSLEGTSIYGLSYLDDIAFEWVEQAIHGLETLLPFCVKGYLEPGRILCTVSYWNCHIVVENDEREPLVLENIHHAYSHTSMIDFCKYLYHDISSNVDDWASFVDYRQEDIGEKRQRLLQMLEILKERISEKETFFDNYCFL